MTRLQTATATAARLHYLKDRAFQRGESFAALTIKRKASADSWGETRTPDLTIMSRAL